MDPIVFRTPKQERSMSRICRLRKLLIQCRLMKLVDHSIYETDKELVTYIQDTTNILTNTYDKFMKVTTTNLGNTFVFYEFITLKMTKDVFNFFNECVKELLNTGNADDFYDKLDGDYKSLDVMEKLIDSIWKFWKHIDTCSLDGNNNKACETVLCKCKYEELLRNVYDYTDYAKQIVTKGLESTKHVKYCGSCILDSSYVGIGRREHLCTKYDNSLNKSLRTLSDFANIDAITNRCIHMEEKLNVTRGERYEHMLFNTF